MINSSRANLSLDLLSFFLQNDSLVFSSTSTFHLCISSVYFTVRRGDLLNLSSWSASKLRILCVVGRQSPIKPSPLPGGLFISESFEGGLIETGLI